MDSSALRILLLHLSYIVFALLEGLFLSGRVFFSLQTDPLAWTCLPHQRAAKGWVVAMEAVQSGARVGNLAGTARGASGDNVFVTEDTENIAAGRAAVGSAVGSAHDGIPFATATLFVLPKALAPSERVGMA